jgi:3-methylfumaryl-CoA hydratase
MRVDAGYMPEWVGKSQTDEDEASLAILRRMAALLDQSADAYALQGVVPQGWHLAFFPTLVPQHQISADGHPEKGAFLPPVPLPRRLFAGRRLEFLQPIAIGAQLSRRSRIASITSKQGKTGSLVFVEVEHVISVEGIAAIRECQDITYRPAVGETTPANEPARSAPIELPKPDLNELFEATPTLLFRYSAVTYNAHRIHYDEPYATREEGYPGLIVNGGLIGLKLCELAKRLRTGKPLRRFEVRHKRPFFANRRGQLSALAMPDGTARVWSLDEEGRLTAEGTAEYEQ